MIAIRDPAAQAKLISNRADIEGWAARHGHDPAHLDQLTITELGEASRELVLSLEELVAAAAFVPPLPAPALSNPLTTPDQPPHAYRQASHDALFASSKFSRAISVLSESASLPHVMEQFVGDLLKFATANADYNQRDDVKRYFPDATRVVEKGLAAADADTGFLPWLKQTHALLGQAKPSDETAVAAWFALHELQAGALDSAANRRFVDAITTAMTHPTAQKLFSTYSLGVLSNARRREPNLAQAINGAADLYLRARHVAPLNDISVEKAFADALIAATPVAPD